MRFWPYVVRGGTSSSLHTIFADPPCPSNIFKNRKNTHNRFTHPPCSTLRACPEDTSPDSWRAMARHDTHWRTCCRRPPPHTQPPSASPPRRPRIGALCHSRRSISCTRRYHMQTPSRSHAPPGLLCLSQRCPPAFSIPASPYPDEYTTDPAAPPPPSQITPTPAGSYISRLNPFPTVMRRHPPAPTIPD